MLARMNGSLLIALAVWTAGVSAQMDTKSLGDDTIVVLGVKQNIRVQLTKGSPEDGGWARNRWGGAVFKFPTDGYLVVKVPANAEGDAYGITTAFPQGVFAGNNGKGYDACKGDEVLTFVAPKGAVLYIGDVSFSAENNPLMTPKASRDIEAAKKYVAAAHPDLADKIVDTQMKLQKMTNYPCQRMTPSS